MDKNILQYFSTYKGLDLSVHDEPVEIIPDKMISEFDNLINEIFSIDPVSGLPRGDIQYYLSKDGNPEVKAWLERNLLMPRAVSSGSSMEGVTDDLIHEMNPQSGESFEDYVARIDGIRNEAVENANSE